MVYVISKNGKPLMPTNRHGKVRRLLKEGKAKVKRRCPFTIKLLYDTTEFTQDLTLGVDTGGKTIGVAVADDECNICYLSKVDERTDVTDKMQQRAKYRRNRRSRKTRYRKARWLNRKNSIRKNRFSPTMISKFNNHIREIEFVKSILPITKTVLECGQFDTHLMKNPTMNRHWGYQKGANYGFENTKAMVLNRDNYTCQHCKGKRKDSKLEAHHIVFRSKGGSDEADNLITLCHTCHKELHEGKFELVIEGKLKGTLKYATQMNSIRKQLLRVYPNAIETFGMVTKANRQSLGIAKDHHLDACVIATGGGKVNIKTNLLFLKKCVAEGDYQRTKGIRSEQSIPKGKIGGLMKFDKVKYFGKEYFVKGRMSSGYVMLMDWQGNTIKFDKMPKGYKTPKISNCKRIGARKSWMVIQKVGIQNIV